MDMEHIKPTAITTFHAFLYLQHTYLYHLLTAQFHAKYWKPHTTVMRLCTKGTEEYYRKELQLQK